MHTVGVIRSEFEPWPSNPCRRTTPIDLDNNDLQPQTFLVQFQVFLDCMQRWTNTGLSMDGLLVLFEKLQSYLSSTIKLLFYST
jgi:hypothetical protein